ncbi:hypothetical protein SAMN00777080_1454 [Aquiflexum balticum DSM 16537]|uniref:Uncharacterized protein n=1 Tax=Aquiflexum balticum DSM 16537 TaxID=758820 RepID=A0A1W2H1P2_9BACT|nr:hypothetical protein [Aquiflexum balticum]SMD42887.1 hypothetical protein SAMN00777080_1454 [Aquiflexum balticum DSM 16537]
MKIFLKTINIGCFILLVLILLGLITSREYEDVLFIAPIFFKDIFIVFIGLFSAIVIYYALNQTEPNRFGKFFLFVAFAIFSFRLSYLSHPIVKLDILFKRLVEYSYNEDDYNEAKGIYEENNSLEYFNLINKEIKMFRSIYKLQFDYLKERNRLNNPHFDSQFLFFLILGFLLIGIGLLESVSKDKSQ